jgi:hypothetical protein
MRRLRFICVSPVGAGDSTAESVEVHDDRGDSLSVVGTST